MPGHCEDLRDDREGRYQERSRGQTNASLGECGVRLIIATFQSFCENIGTNARLNAPSAKKRRNMIGECGRRSTNALIRGTRAQKGRTGLTISRTKPSITRLKRVQTPTVKIACDHADRLLMRFSPVPRLLQNCFAQFSFPTRSLLGLPRGTSNQTYLSHKTYPLPVHRKVAITALAKCRRGHACQACGSNHAADQGDPAYRPQ